MKEELSTDPAVGSATTTRDGDSRRSSRAARSGSLSAATPDVRAGIPAPIAGHDAVARSPLPGMFHVEPGSLGTLERRPFAEPGDVFHVERNRRTCLLRLLP